MSVSGRIVACGLMIGLGQVALGATESVAQTAAAQTAAATVTGETAALTEPVLSPEALRMRDALAAAGEGAEPLLEFYAGNDYEPVWSELRRGALFAALDNAPVHGLPAERYDVEGLRAIFQSGDPLLAEIAASQTFLTYARDINSGLLEPRKVDSDLHISPRRPDQVALLEGLSRAGDPTAFLGALAPAHPDYEGLLAEKARLEAVIAAGGWGAEVPGGTLKPDQSSPRVVELRARLGRIDGADHGDSPAYDTELVETVKAFQLRHGLNDDGVAGPKTLAAVNASAEQRLKQVLVNLERQRWLNYDRGARHIYVNQADFSVQVIDDGETTYSSRVVIGKNQHRTQEFNDEMTHMVINPTWHVPRSIATEELLPKLKRNPGALGSSMQIMTRSGTSINPRFVNFNQFTASNFPFVMKQRPGGGNALGRVKFMFPNQFNIYLHDTPAKSLFNRDVRAYSHGCVRVQKPFELAYHLLGAQSADPKGLFHSVLNTGKERYVNLDTPVPVYLTYQSAWVDAGGQPQYRDDIYGRDARVFDALERAGVDLPAG